jgi:hypothetical protein
MEAGKPRLVLTAVPEGQGKVWELASDGCQNPGEAWAAD